MENKNELTNEREKLETTLTQIYLMIEWTNRISCHKKNTKIIGSQINDLYVFFLENYR